MKPLRNPFFYAVISSLSVAASSLANGQVPTPPTNSVVVMTGQKLSPFTFASFGNPSITNNGTIIFRTTVERRGQQVVKGMPLERVVRRDMAVPGIAGATFMLFSDPVLTDEFDVHNGGASLPDRIAFIGVFRGSGITSANNQAIFSDRSGTLLPVARKGSGAWAAAPGQTIPGGAWGRFISVAADGDVVAFTAQMVNGGSINSGNDFGLWMSNLLGGVATNRLLLREGAVIQVNGARVIRSFQVLRVNSLGKGHGFGLTGARVLARVNFVDRSQALIWVDSDGVITPFAQTGITDAPGYAVGSKMKTFGVPSFSRSGYPAFKTGLFVGTGNVTAATKEAIVTGHNGTLQTIVKSGNAAAGGPVGSLFKKLGDPVMNEWGDVLFSATLGSGGVSRQNDFGLWLNSFGTNQLFLREGDPAPGMAGPTLRGFPSAALTVFYTEFQEPYGMGEGEGYSFYEGSPMVVVEGLLNRVNGVTTRSDQAAWATDWFGNKHLLMREGVTQLTVGSRVRTVKSFRVINRVLGSPAQKHSYNNFGEIVAAVAFTDRTQAIIKFKMPEPDFVRIQP